MSAHSAREILRRRAQALAQPTAAIVEEVSTPVLVVGVENGTAYGLPASFIEHVFDDLHLCRLPSGSGELIAVTVVRGAAVPVADLASVLGLASPRQDRTFLVLLGGTRPLGLLVDDVVEMVPLRRSELRVLPSVPGDSALNLYQGMMPGGVPLLDVAALLDDPRVIIPRGSQSPSGIPALSQSGAT
jgi:chemotaxis signal transduction protein